MLETLLLTSSRKETVRLQHAYGNCTEQCKCSLAMCTHRISHCMYFSYLYLYVCNIIFMRYFSIFLDSHAYINAYFQGSNTSLPIPIDDINCRGTEASLINCAYSTFIQTSTCRTNHMDDAGVRCVPGGKIYKVDHKLLSYSTISSKLRNTLCCEPLNNV